MGKPFVRGPGPVQLAKLKEEWTPKGQLWPCVYIGVAHPKNRWIKFLVRQHGVSQQQQDLLKQGLAIGAKVGDEIRMLQLVSPESESGLFRYGKNGLEAITEEELHGKPQRPADNESQSDSAAR